MDINQDRRLRIALACIALAVCPAVTTVFIFTAFAPALVLPLMSNWALGITEGDSSAPWLAGLLVLGQLTGYFTLYYWLTGVVLGVLRSAATRRTATCVVLVVMGILIAVGVFGTVTVDPWDGLWQGNLFQLVQRLMQCVPEQRGLAGLCKEAAL